jgi:hypothetical protein
VEWAIQQVGKKFTGKGMHGKEGRKEGRKEGDGGEEERTTTTTTTRGQRATSERV